MQEAQELARSPAASHSRELWLINVALSPVYRAYPDLRFPVELYDAARVLPGGVYYDPDLLRANGRTVWARDPEPRGLVTLDPRPVRPPIIVDSGPLTAEPGSDPNSVFCFIKLGPGALSEGTRAWTRSLLFHEHEHFRLHMEAIGQGWEGIGTRASMSTTDPDLNAEHALIHARTFRTFFSQLEWRGTFWGRGDPLWRDDLQPLPPAEAAYDLTVIQHEYFAAASPPGRAAVVEEVMGVADTDERLARLRGIVTAMRPDLVGVAPEGRFKQSLLDALQG